MSKEVQIFIAYSRRDADLLSELRSHLTPLTRSRRVKVWYDGEIIPGAVWESDIKKHLQESDIILLLVSADAIASDYFYEKEMGEALERHENGSAHVVPLILRPCDWRPTPLGKLQALPKNGTPVTSWVNRDDALNDAVVSLRKLVDSTQHVKEKAAKEKSDPIPQKPDTPVSPGRVQKKTCRLWVFLAVVAIIVILGIMKYSIPILDQSDAIDEIALSMVKINGGIFQRGSNRNDHEMPIQEVRISDFQIGKYEVSQGQWLAVMGGNPSYNHGCDVCPVEQVSWTDVQDFIKQLNKLTGLKYRLPTEAEWEYAACGGSQGQIRLFSGSDVLNEVAWYSENYGLVYAPGAQKTTHPVGTKAPNELGLFDMSGNVWEWCEDDWRQNYHGAPDDGSAWIDSPRNPERVCRGGGWLSRESLCRTTVRNRHDSSYRSGGLGFRLVLQL